MASPIATAMVYLTFALTFAIVYVMVLDIRAGSDIYRAVAYKFTRMPWKVGEQSYMKDVASPGDVYQWLNNTWRRGVRDLELNTDGDALASLNRVLFGRLTLKRFKFKDNKSTRFGGNYPKVLGLTRMDATADNGDNEDKASFGSLPYVYSSDKGYNYAGGYVIFINPDDAQAVVDKQILDTSINGWFDLRFGSLVAEIIVFNGNVKKFFRLSFIFETSFSGVIKTRSEAVAFDLSLYDFVSSRATENVVRLILEIVVILLTCYIVKCELEDMADDTWAYVRNPVSLFDITAVTIVLTCIVLYYEMVLGFAYSNFTFPLPSPSETEERMTAFNDLVDISNDTVRLQSLVSWAICIVFVRAVTLLCDLSPSWGTLFRTIAQGKYLFLYFIFIFHTLFIGFAFAGQFMFGGSVESMSSFWLAFLTSLRMLLGDPLYRELQRGDTIMIGPFYFGFMLIFYFVLVNMFLSIIVSSYDKEKAEQRKLTKTQGPLSKMAELFLDMLTTKFGFLQNIKNAKYLFGAGSDRKVNFEYVNELRSLKTRHLYPGSPECLLIVVMQLVFLSALLLFARVSSTFQMSTDLEWPLKSKKWMQHEPTREMSLDVIEEFEDVYAFATNVLLDKLYDCTGTSNPRLTCRESKQDLSATRSDYALFVGPLVNPKKAQLSIGFVPTRVSPKAERLPRAGEWNVGITNANFVRVTIQVACFRPSEDERFADGYKNVYSELHSDCARNGCMARNIELDSECLDSAGNPIQLKQKNGTSFGGRAPFTYVYTTDGTYLKLGGYSIGLGKTREEAAGVLAQLQADTLFTTNSVSIVFDWALYNGNLDLFIHQAVEFSMEPTNVVSTKSVSSVFSFNVFTEGNEDLQNNRFMLRILLMLYCALLLVYILNFLRDLKRQLQISAELQRGILTACIDFFRDDPWNIVDSVSVAFNILAAVYFFQLWPRPSGFPDAFKFLERPTVTQVENSYDTLDNLSVLGDTYLRFRNASAFNILFLIMRLLKYMCEVTVEVLYIKEDEHPLGDMEVKWNAHDRLLVLFAVREGGLTYAAGVRNGWIVEQIGDMVVLEAYKEKVRKFGGITGQFLSAESYFVQCLKRTTDEPLRPLTVCFRSHTGVTGTILKTIRNSASQLFNFALVQLMAMLGFVFKFTLDYGTQFKHFADFPSSFVTLFRYMIGEFDIDELLEYHQGLTIFNFIVFELIFYFILSNMFLATLVEAWRQMRQEAVDGFLSNLGYISGNARRRFTEKWLPKIAGSKADAVIIDESWWSQRGALRYIYNLTDAGAVVLEGNDRSAFSEKLNKAQYNIALQVAFKEQNNLEEKDAVEKHLSITSRVTHTLSTMRRSLRRGNVQASSNAPTFLEADPYLVSDVNALVARLENQLTRSDGAQMMEELWLDGFLTCLENAGVIEKVRSLFKNERQPMPVTIEEKRVFDEKKALYGLRLQRFFDLIKAKSSLQYHAWIAGVAKTKTEVLEGQNFVFNDYLEMLENKSQTLDDEIANIRARTDFLRLQLSATI